ncbi:alpha/beta hydrolase [Actibacterium sp. 188UL27-1]|uniref:alpha/beta hydrolase n=1 Tax=Actibacterium sp. 188UL27-1 TaxID=2786961 RepID=UPI0019587594|nr:alpha/beta fold hydrolase [Actibacterium sp. 188UL27-1]MBM7067238.1 alpha/beta fold hydrolase [Actibacterium sp. 188UL27-1]
MTRLTLLLVVLVMGCAPRANLVIVPDTANVGSVQRIFVTTSRDYSETTQTFAGFARGAVRFAQIDVSIPPSHRAGHIALPGRRPPDPANHVLATRMKTYPGAPDFRSDLSRALRAKGGEAVIYVHGFNNTMADGVFRIAQLTHDLQGGGLPMNYAWPSAGNPLGYVYDRDSALYARDGLEEMLQQVTDAGAQEIVMVAHSMGALVTMETLRQLAIAGNQRVLDRIGGVILMSPDLDVEVFRSQASRIGALPQPFVLFTSTRDRALRLSARLTGRNERLGSLATADDVADLSVTILDVSEFRDPGQRHFAPATSPSLLRIISRLAEVDGAFQRGDTGRTGLLPGTVLTVRNATQVILSPTTALSATGTR